MKADSIHYFDRYRQMFGVPVHEERLKKLVISLENITGCTNTQIKDALFWASPTIRYTYSGSATIVPDEHSIRFFEQLKQELEKELV